MTKSEKQDHDQKLINSYNTRIEEIDREISQVNNAFASMLLMRNKRTLLKRLMKLYNTEKYGLA